MLAELARMTSLLDADFETIASSQVQRCLYLLVQAVERFAQHDQHAWINSIYNIAIYI